MIFFNLAKSVYGVETVFRSSREEVIQYDGNEVCVRSMCGVCDVYGQCEE